MSSSRGIAFVYGGGKFEERDVHKVSGGLGWKLAILSPLVHLSVKGRAHRKAEKCRFYLLIEGVTKGINIVKDEGLHPFLQSTTAINKIMFCVATFKQVILDGLFLFMSST